MKLHWLSELDVLGAHLSGGSLKSWGTKCVPIPLVLRKKPGAGSSFPPVCCYAAGGVWWHCVLASPTQYGCVCACVCFLIYLIHGSSSASFRGSCSMCGCRFSVCGRRWVQEPPMSPPWPRLYIFKNLLQKLSLSPSYDKNSWDFLSSASLIIKWVMKTSYLFS